MATEPFNLKVWRCHPQSARIIPAEKTLNGTANAGGAKWCGPYTSANKSGFWLFPPIDIDITWKGGQEFDYKLLEEYTDADYHLIRQLIRPGDVSDPDKWCPPGGRSKFTWGLVEPGVVQMWTGCIFETPPGWCLHVRSPVNFAPRPMYVMEGVIETDWMQYDIWTNLVFTTPGETVQLRKDGWPPLAQLVPVRRETFAEKWTLSEEPINRDTPEANRVFEYWIDYNHKKFGMGGKQNLTADGSVTKDGTTYHREKMRLVGRNMEPDPKLVCPFAKPKSRAVVYILNDPIPRRPITHEWPKNDYAKMGLNSFQMLRKYNTDIPVKVILVDSHYQDLEDKFKALGAEVIHKHNVDHGYFPLNKVHLGEVEEDEVLYIDVDTFVNGDVARLFDKYSADFTACDNAWVWGMDWREEYLPNRKRPWNSGVILFKNGYHKSLYPRLPEACAQLLEGKTPLAQWVMAKNQWVREEFAGSLLVAGDGVRSDYFLNTDCYNIRRKEDVAMCHEPIIFHSYTQQWEMIDKMLSRRRKMVWRTNTQCGRTDTSQET